MSQTINGGKKDLVMALAQEYDSLDQILDELLRLDRFQNNYDRGRFSEWIANAEKEWLASGKQAEAGKELLENLWRYRFSWLDHPDGSGLFYVTALDRHTRDLSELWGERNRRTLFELEQRPKHPFPIYAWYFDRFIPWFWQSIKEEYTSKNWPNMCVTRLRPPSPMQFVWIVRHQHARQGLSQNARKELVAALKECRSMTLIPDMDVMARELEKELAASGEVTEKWLSWCRDVLTPCVTKVDEGAIIAAAYLRPIAIGASELSRLAIVIDDGQSWEPSNYAAPSVKAWMKHIVSSKCEESPGTLVNHLIMRLAVARGYQQASGELRLVRYRTPTGAFSKHIDTMERILRHTLKKKIIFEPSEFEEFLRLLLVLNTLNVPHFESVAKLCESHAETHSLTPMQLSQLTTFFDQVSWRDSDDLRKGTKTWDNLRDRCSNDLTGRRTRVETSL